MCYNKQSTRKNLTIENKTTFKQQYKIGLDLLKEDIEKCKQIEKLYDSLTDIKILYKLAKRR